MSTKPPPAEPSEAATARPRLGKQIDTAFEEASKLAGSVLPPAEFYQEFLNCTLRAVSAPAGAVWLRTPQGFLQIACQVNLEQVGLDNKRGGRQCHNEVLRQVFQAAPPRPVMIEPQGRLSGLAAADAGAAPPANLTDYWTLFAPIASPDKEQKVPLGLLEIFQDASHDPRAYPTFLNFTHQMAGYASQYHSYTAARQSSGLEKVYSQVETFAKLIHSSLNPTEVAYHVANEGRRLVECDRLCVGVRHNRKTTVEAVSGADVVEKASTHVRRMKALFDEVLTLGDKLVYKGEMDEGLPPKLSRALDDYLAESQPKLLVVMPIRDEQREKDKDNGKKARSILLMESFNPPEQIEPLIQRLEVVGKHAAGALYNAAEMKRIPMGIVWRPLAKLQDGLGGKHRLYAAAAGVGITALLLAMVLVPYPLKMDATGQFLPQYVAQVFPPTEGEVRQFLHKQGDRVAPGSPVVQLFSPTLQEKYIQYDSEASAAESQMRELDKLINKPNLPTEQVLELNRKKYEYEAKAAASRQFLRELDAMYHLVPGRPGHFNAVARELDASVRAPGAAWTVLSSDNTTELMHRTMKQSEPMVRLGYTGGPWRIELKIPQRGIGHIAKALATPGMHKTDKAGKKYLDVDTILTSAPADKYPGRMYEEDIAGEAIPNQDDHNQSDPVVMAYVRMNVDPDPAAQVPRELFVAGQEVHTKVKCGPHALGYSLFHGVYEWFYEKVVFFI